MKIKVKKRINNSLQKTEQYITNSTQNNTTKKAQIN